MHLQSINPSADPVLIKKTYEHHELYVGSSMTYKRIIKMKRRRKKVSIASSYGNLLELKRGHKGNKEGISSNVCRIFRGRSYKSSNKQKSQV